LLEEVKNENNRLTEQLVEASLESAQNFESFSNDRNALWNLTQELRSRVQAEQTERQHCTAMLTSTQEALERLATENVQLAEELMRSRASEQHIKSGAALPEKTVNALWTVHQREISRLRSEIQQRVQECEHLRQFVRQQATQANATILEMARRNLELEEKFSEACRALEEHGLTPPALTASDTLPTLAATVPATPPPSSFPGIAVSQCVTTPRGGGSERRSSSLPPSLGGRPRDEADANTVRNACDVHATTIITNNATRADKDAENHDVARTATAAATAATEAANTATRAANAAAAAAAAAAQSESFARAELLARFDGGDGSLNGFAHSFLASSDTSANASSSVFRTSIDSQRGYDRRAEASHAQTAVRRSHSAGAISQLQTSVTSAASAGEQLSSISKLAEARDVRRRRAGHQQLHSSRVSAGGSDSAAENSVLTPAVGSSTPALLTPDSSAAAIGSGPAELPSEYWGRSPRSPFMGVDARYTGRGMSAHAVSHRPPRRSLTGSSARKSDRLQNDLDILSVEMRRVQQRALLAAQ
jgi:hypothetical protein